jgi:hypothetical protein
MKESNLAKQKYQLSWDLTKIVSRNAIWAKSHLRWNLRLKIKLKLKFEIFSRNPGWIMAKPSNITPYRLSSPGHGQTLKHHTLQVIITRSWPNPKTSHLTGYHHQVMAKPSNSDQYCMGKFWNRIFFEKWPLSGFQGWPVLCKEVYCCFTFASDWMGTHDFNSLGHLHVWQWGEKSKDVLNRFFDHFIVLVTLIYQNSVSCGSYCEVVYRCISINFKITF